MTQSNAIAQHKACGTVTMVPDVWKLWERDEEAARLWFSYQRIICSGCGAKVFAYPTTAKKGKRACGSWCTEGTGKTCTCECEGRNHGAKYAPGTLFYLS